MKYSIVFLDYDPNAINRDAATKSLASILINSIGYDFEIIHVKNVIGFVNAVNEGLVRAKGEYIVTVANDVILDDARWLDKLAIPDTITGWRETPFFITGIPRPDFACWCIPATVRDAIGLMDTQYQYGYGFDDDDYILRAREIGFKTKDAHIELKHEESLTYDTVFAGKKKGMMLHNEILFREKWSMYAN